LPRPPSAPSAFFAAEFGQIGRTLWEVERHFMNVFSKKKNPPVETNAAETTPALTPGEWAERTAAVERQIAEAQQTLEAKREERRASAGLSIIFGGAGIRSQRLKPKNAPLSFASICWARHSSSVGLNSRSLRTPKNVSGWQNGALQQQVGQKILEHARRVDQAFADAAEDLRNIDALFRDYVNAGGPFQTRRNASRAAHGTGLRNFISADYVGDNVVCAPLPTQFRS
jgi:hypothetical protein